MLLALPLEHAVAHDAYLGLLELDALTMASPHVRLEDVHEFAPTILVSSVTDALRLALSAADDGGDVLHGTVRLVVLTCEPGGSLEVTRRTIEDRWGARCLDIYALTELGIVGWGCAERRNGIHLDDQRFLLEVRDADSGKVVPDGALGELFVSTVGDWGREPLHGLRTGDLVRLQHDACACGRGSAWAAGGILGRVTDRLPLRGQLLLPSSIEQVVRRHPAVIDFALKVFTVRGDCEVSVLLEPTHAMATESDLSRVAAEVAEDLKRTFGMRLHCDVVPPGSISATHEPGQRARRLLR